MRFKNYTLKTISSLPFYTMPKILIDDVFFKDLSGDAKLLYMVMQNRVTLSQQNNWADENGDIYIYMVIDEVQNILHCSREKAVNMIKQLKNIGLLETKRQGQGKPNKIYIKEISNYKKFENGKNELQEVQESEFLEIQKTEFIEVQKTEFSEVQKSNGINTDIINTNISNTDSSSSNARAREEKQPLLPPLNSAYIKKYIDSIRATASKFEIDQLTSYEEDGISGEVIELAIEEALLNNKPNLKYIKAILDRCLDENILTPEQFNARKNMYKTGSKSNNESNNKANNQPKNKWANLKEVETREIVEFFRSTEKIAGLTDEELQEIDEEAMARIDLFCIRNFLLEKEKRGLPTKLLHKSNENALKLF